MPGGRRCTSARLREAHHQLAAHRTHPHQLLGGSAGPAGCQLSHSQRNQHTAALPLPASAACITGFQTDPKQLPPTSVQKAFSVSEDRAPRRCQSSCPPLSASSHSKRPLCFPGAAPHLHQLPGRLTGKPCLPGPVMFWAIERAFLCRATSALLTS